MKNKLYYQYKRRSSDFMWRKYSNYRNTLTSVLRTAKKQYYSARFKMTFNNIKNTWKVIRSIFKSPLKTSNIKCINVNGCSVEDTQIIVNKFNEYFCNVGLKLQDSIPRCQKNFFDFMQEPNTGSLFLMPTNEAELLKLVNSLKSKKSPGFDGIKNELIKDIVQGIVIPLVYIFNLSFLSGIVPKRMKIAKVVPIFKKGDPQTLSNYRPISLLTSFSKILEKLIYDRTVTFLNKTKIFSKFQFGFS